MTEDEMAGWYHRLDGHEFEGTPGVGDGHEEGNPEVLSSCSGGLRALVELCVEPAGLCGRCTGCGVGGASQDSAGFVAMEEGLMTS